MVGVGQVAAEDFIKQLDSAVSAVAHRDVATGDESVCGSDLANQQRPNRDRAIVDRGNFFEGVSRPAHHGHKADAGHPLDVLYWRDYRFVCGPVPGLQHNPGRRLLAVFPRNRFVDFCCNYAVCKNVVC